jgi:argininosuccinate synthase
LTGGGLEEELAERIKRALERGDPLELVAEVNSFFEERGLGRVIVVGGFAVEIYSGGAYRTGDIDIVVEGSGALLRRALSMVEEWRGRV